MKNNNPILKPKIKEPQISSQNANGAFNSKIQNKFAIQKNNNIKKNIGLNNNNNPMIIMIIALTKVHSLLYLFVIPVASNVNIEIENTTMSSII